MVKSERCSKPGVLLLVVLVEVQPEAEELQRLVLAARQLQQERLDHVLIIENMFCHSHNYSKKKCLKIFFY